MHYTLVLMMKEVDISYTTLLPYREAPPVEFRINKKPIPMTDLIIDFINKQAKKEKQGIEFSNINKNITVNYYKERGSDSDSDFKDDDK